jgi:2-polyprenyl-3-methyl-5-hydroxy-6-metoxy-1,4-benzoquinol methylase
MPALIHDVCLVNKITGRGLDSNFNYRAFTDEEFFMISHELNHNQLYPSFRALFENFALWIKENFNPKSVLDHGCGPGYLIHLLNEIDIYAIGVDGNPYSKKLFDELHLKYNANYILDKFFDAKYDTFEIFTSVECFEHIPDNGINKIMTRVSQEIKPNHIIFSSTPYADPNPGWDIQWGHINMKQPNEWHALFLKYGYQLIEGVTPPLTPWASVYKNTK